MNDISIHALLAESDLNSSWISSIRKNFYPRSPCGERPEPCATPTKQADISIHALLAESDRSADCNCRSVRPISIHALLAESDFIFMLLLVSILPFLSTLSLRRAT